MHYHGEMKHSIFTKLAVVTSAVVAFASPAIKAQTTATEAAENVQQSVSVFERAKLLTDDLIKQRFDELKEAIDEGEEKAISRSAYLLSRAADRFHLVYGERDGVSALVSEALNLALETVTKDSPEAKKIERLIKNFHEKDLSAGAAR